MARNDTIHPADRADLADSEDSEDSEFERQFFRELYALYLAEFHRLRSHGHELGELGDPLELAERVVASTPLEPSPLEDLVGPFYSTPVLARWLGITRQAIHERVKSLTLLGMQTGDKTWVYPAWQFTADGQVIPHLADVLRPLSTGTSERWTWALWLTAPNEDWDDLPAWRWLADGRDPIPVLAEARADAARWRT